MWAAMERPVPPRTRRGAIFSVEEGDGRSVPRVLVAPSRYIQGEGALAHLGRYLSVVPSTRPALLLSVGGQQRDGARIVGDLRAAGVDPVEVTFGGECSETEVERVADALRAQSSAVDGVVAVGGGKCVDAGKCVAARLGVPVVICPTIASNDAPCSALSLMYTPEGAFTDLEFFLQSPAMVVVDTRVVAEAPVRYLYGFRLMMSGYRPSPLSTNGTRSVGQASQGHSSTGEAPR